MNVQTTCENCGRTLRAAARHGGRRVACPGCGHSIRLPEAKDDGDREEWAMSIDEFLDAPEPRQSAATRDRPTPDEDGFPADRPADDGVPPLEKLMQRLLDPRSIQWMLVTGGGLMVVGIVVWLVSIGVFEDPRIVAVALGAGALAVVGTGCAVAKKTRHRIAGEAVAFLGCVLLPLNIWFLHAQSLLDLGQLWIGGVVCCATYLGVLLLLRSPVFVYAIEAGVTLTVLLLLYDLGHIAELHTLALVFLGLGLVSIHLERAFPPQGEFDRGRYGLAVFWCGHAQLAAALLVLLGTQLANWVVWPLYAFTGPLPRLADQHLLAAGMYLAATYAYLYSDLVVRRLAVYTSLAGVTFALALLTFVLDNRVPIEAVALVLAVLAIAVHLARGMSLVPNERLQRAALPIGLVLGAVPVLIGYALHVRATNPAMADWNWSYQPTWLFVVAMLVTALAGHVGAHVWARVGGDDRRLVQAHSLLGGAAVLLAAAGLLRMFGVVGWPGKAACLVPIAGLYLAGARLHRGKAYEWPLYWTAQAATAVVMLGLLFSAHADLRQLVAVTGNTTNLVIAGVFAEAFVFYLAAALVWRRGRNTYFAAVAACGVVWQLLSWNGVEGQLYFVLFAVLGTAFLFASRALGIETAIVYDEDDRPLAVSRGRGLPALQSGVAITALSLVAAGLHGLFLLAGGAADWGQVWGLLFVILAGVVASFLVASEGWRRFFVTASIGLVAVCGLTLNTLIDLDAWDKLQLLSLVVGVGLLVQAHVLLLREKEGEKNPDAAFGTTLGSLLAVVPIGIAAIRGQLLEGGPNWQAFLTLTASILLLVAGTTLRVRGTTIVGGGMLAAYLLTVVGSLAYHPQTPVGVYLAVGGILVFASGIALSIYRDRIVQLPRRMANGEGVFAILKWR